MKVSKKNIEYLIPMKTIKITIPDTVELDDKEALMAIAAHLYEKGKLSLGQGAELVGLSKAAFMENLGDFGVSLFNYSESDLESDVENAKNYHL
jgi:predicted HTH domain antitoxin